MMLYCQWCNESLVLQSVQIMWTCASKKAMNTNVSVYNRTLIDMSLCDHVFGVCLVANTSVTLRLCEVALVMLVNVFSIILLACVGLLCGPWSRYCAGTHGPKKQRTANRGSSLHSESMFGLTPISEAMSSITGTQYVWKRDINFVTEAEYCINV